MYQRSGIKVSTLKYYFGYYLGNSRAGMAVQEELLLQIAEPAASFNCLGAAGNAEFTKDV